MKLLEWLADREEIHPGISLNGMTMLQETSGLAGADGLPWEAVARAAADLLKLGLIDWRYVRPFNEVGDTPPHLMDQRYVQRVEDIMVTAEGSAAMAARRSTGGGTTVNIVNSTVGQVALGDISNIDVFVILEAAERALGQLDAPPEVKAEARGVLQRMREAGASVGTGAVAEILAAAVRRAFGLP